VKDGIVRLTDFEALSFDCYGTLIDWETGIADQLRPWAQAAGKAPDDEVLLGGFAEQEARWERDHPDLVYPQILAGSMRTLGEQLGIPVGDGDAEGFGASVPQWPAFPDSHDALASLQRHFTLIVLSNVDRASFAGSNHRLGVSFDRIITAEDVGSYKPSPRNFDALLAALPDLGVAPGRLLHVAQSLFHDHVPAKEAGLPTVWINRRHDRDGWGATPAPATRVTPDRVYPSMASFARACEEEAGERILTVGGGAVGSAAGGMRGASDAQDQDHRRAGRRGAAAGRLRG
jgi:2-haloacid dehalogenase